jgi:hypothetical protein
MVAGTAASAGISAYGSVMQGKEQARAADFERQQLEVQGQQIRTAADQSEAERRRELASSIETVQVLRGGRGVGTASPTGLAILDEMIEGQERDIGIERSNYMTKASQSQAAAEMARRKGKYSMLAGYLGAGQAISSGAANTFALGSGRYPVAAPRASSF